MSFRGALKNKARVIRSRILFRNYLAHIPLPLIIWTKGKYLPPSVRILFAQRLESEGLLKAAQEMVLAISLDRYDKEKQLLAAFLATNFRGIPSVDSFVNGVYNGLKRDTSGWQPEYLQLARYYETRSSEQLADRLENVRSLLLRIKSDPKVPNAQMASIRLSELNLRRKIGHIVSVKDYMPLRLPKNGRVCGGVHKIIPLLKREGWEEEALELISLCERSGSSNAITLKINHFPEMVDASDIEIPDRLDRIVDLIWALTPLQDLSPAHKEKTSQLVEVMHAKFTEAPRAVKNSCLNFLIRNDFLEEANQWEAELPASMRSLQSARVIRAWQHFDEGSYNVAVKLFRDVVSQNPKHNVACDGLQCSLTRAGWTLADVEAELSKLGVNRGPLSQERVWVFRSEGRLEDLARANLNAPKLSSIASTYPDQFLTELPDEDFGESSLFFFASSGVGDEIRNVCYYDAISKLFRKVKISCDPRLVNILSSNFPSIEFLPCSRSRVRTSENIGRNYGRFRGANGALNDILREDLRPDLEGADFIASVHTFQIAHAQKKIKVKRSGVVIKAPKPEEAPASDKPVRIGLLWRSGLVRGVRRHFYFSPQEFEMLSSLESIEIHVIQNDLTEEERNYCLDQGWVLRGDIDFYNDLEALSNYLASLDLTIGISTATTEMAALLGVATWFVGFSPESYYLRAVSVEDNTDWITPNAKVMAPRDLNFNTPKRESVRSAIEVIRDELSRSPAEIRKTLREQTREAFR